MVFIQGCQPRYRIHMDGQVYPELAKSMKSIDPQIPQITRIRAGGQVAEACSPNFVKISDVALRATTGPAYANSFAGQAGRLAGQRSEGRRDQESEI